MKIPWHLYALLVRDRQPQTTRWGSKKKGKKK